MNGISFVDPGSEGLRPSPSYRKSISHGNGRQKGGSMRWRKQFDVFARGRQDALPKIGNAVFDEFLADKSQRLGKLLGVSVGGKDGAAAKRAVKKRIRSIKTVFRERRRGRVPVDLLAFQRHAGRLVDALCPTRAKDWLGPLNRAKMGSSVEFEVSDFSFLEKPDETLAQISKIVRAECGAWDIQVHFDDHQCMDIAPYVLLAMVWHDLAPIFSGGRMTHEVQRVVDAVQLRRPLKMGRFRATVGVDNVRAFPLHRRRLANSSRSLSRHLDPQTREKVQDGFVATINDWLGQKEIDRELTPFGRGSIKNIIGEVLDNAERHSEPATMDGDWTIAGFMARRDDDKLGVRFHCSISFVSIGASIAESLATSPPSVASAVQQYVDRHRKTVPEEVLRTIMAVQDGITRVTESVNANRGGTGFQDVFDLVNELGDTNLSGCSPRVTILSGKACLKLFGRCSKGVRRPNDPFSPREIWFNDENDSHVPPDPLHAFSLRQPFPGTLVTLAFVFEPTVIDGEDNG